MSHLFDGQFRSRPTVNLAGSSHIRDRDHLIREAFLERKRREDEKKQQLAATKIQSVFRSYTVRKRIKNEIRMRFQSIFSNSQNDNLNQIETLLGYFVSYFDPRLDQDDLNKFSQFLFKNKEKVIQSNLKVQYSLVKFLAIHLNILNSTSTQISHSVSLRLIDYFTDSNQQEQKTILKLLITKYAYLNQLVKYAIQKIPSTVLSETQAPLIFSLGHLINRAFLCFTEESLTFNELIAKKIFTELFAQSNHNQIQCIIRKIAQISNSNNQINNIVYFLKAIENIHR